MIAFINENFDWKLPLVNLPEYFNFYYHSGDALQYALAEENGELLAGSRIHPGQRISRPGHLGLGVGWQKRATTAWGWT